MIKQKIKTFNLRKEKDIKEFSKVSMQELVKINKELTKYKTGIIQKKILIILFNYEKKHHKMMHFDDIGVATNYKPNLSGMFLKRLTGLIDIGLINYHFDDEYKNAYTVEEYYEYGLTPKGKRFIDFMWNKR